MKNKQLLFGTIGRLWFIGVIIIAMASACSGNNQTSAPREAPNNEISPSPEPDLPTNANDEAVESTEAPTEEPTPVPTAEPTDTVVPTASTGTIRGMVELSGYTNEPLVDTIVEIYDSQNYYQATTNEKGEFIIPDVIPGAYEVNVVTNEGITNYQLIYVVGGEETLADIYVFKAFPTPTLPA